MSDQEKFLTRWSRRKQEIAGEIARSEQPAVPDADRLQDDGKQEAGAKPASPKAKTPDEFDLSTLPSIDSIGASSDIRAFLQTGVPAELKHAALRRAWSADPAIRDFKGLAENDWDFTAADSMRGFGDLDPGTDIQKMLAEIFPETPRADALSSELPKPAEQLIQSSHELSSSVDRAAGEQAEKSTPASEVPGPKRIATAETDKIVHCEENIAPQDDSAETAGAQLKRRPSQGGAMPQ